jgi:hypothetical protein
LPTVLSAADSYVGRRHIGRQLQSADINVGDAVIADKTVGGAKNPGIQT